jgi:hypothetical protein
MRNHPNRIRRLKKKTYQLQFDVQEKQVHLDAADRGKVENQLS